MSTWSSEIQPKAPTASQQPQPDSPVASAQSSARSPAVPASTPRSAPFPAVPPSAPPPAGRPYQGYNAQPPYWQQQQQCAPQTYAPQYPARQPSIVPQPIRQQSVESSDTYCCCDVKTAVRVFATIILVVYLLGAGGYAYGYSTGSVYMRNGTVFWITFAVVTLIIILDVVNAYCVQSSCWYCTSSVIWCFWVGLTIVGLLFITFVSGDSISSSTSPIILWIIKLLDIALFVAYIVALCKASDAAAKQQPQDNVMQSQPQYAPQPPVRTQYANHQQRYRV